MRRSKDESNRQRKPDIKWRGQGSAETERAVDSGRLEKGADKSLLYPSCFIKVTGEKAGGLRDTE